MSLPTTARQQRPPVVPYTTLFRSRIKVEVDTYEVTGETHRAARDRQNLLVDNPPLALKAPRIIATTLNSVSIAWDPEIGRASCREREWNEGDDGSLRNTRASTMQT